MVNFQAFQLIDFLGTYVYINYFSIGINKNKEIALFKETKELDRIYHVYINELI